MATQMNGNFLLPYREGWAYSAVALGVVLSIVLPLCTLCLSCFPKTGSESSNILLGIYAVTQ